MNAQAIYQILRDDADVVTALGTRIMPDMATQTVAYPFAVYEIGGTLPTDTKDGSSRLDTVEANIMIYAQSHATAQDIAEKVREAMDRKRGTFASVEIDSIRFTDQRSAQFDFEKNVFVVDQTYQIRAKR